MPNTKYILKKKGFHYCVSSYMCVNFCENLDIAICLYAYNVVCDHACVTGVVVFYPFLLVSSSFSIVLFHENLIFTAPVFSSLNKYEHRQQYVYRKPRVLGFPSSV